VHIKRNLFHEVLLVIKTRTFPRHTPLIAIVEWLFVRSRTINPPPEWRRSLRNDFSSPPPGNCTITSGLSERTTPNRGCPSKWEREEKLPSALGRQVGRQADIELYISISWYLRGNIRGRARYFMGLVNIAGRRELAGKAAAFSFAFLLHPFGSSSLFLSLSSLSQISSSLYISHAYLPLSGPET